MANTPYTQQRSVQFRGPTTSENYNQRIEENYNDITLLYNRASLNESIVEDGYGRFMKDQFGILQMVENLESRVTALEADINTIVFYNDNQIDNTTFDSTSFAIAAVNQCQVDTLHGIITLPTVPTSSISKLSFVDNSGNTNIPASLGTSVVGAGADSGTATIDSSPPELAIARNIGSIWQRNVVVPSPVYGGAQLTLYISAPTDLFTVANANSIILHPFPAFSTDITDISYTTNTSPTMADSDGYVEFPAYYVNDNSSIGWTTAGSWNGNADTGAGFRVYYFDPTPITGLRIKLNQSNYYFDGSNYIYSYGASLIDLRYEKFLPTGQVMIRMDAPTGSVINSVNAVLPYIYNVSQATIPEVFSYKIVYETAYQSGIYTLTPVAESKRVWVLVTLSQTPAGGTPALSGLTLTYS